MAATLGLGTIGVAAAADAPETTPSDPATSTTLLPNNSPQRALQICEDMVRNSVVAATGGTLVAPQVGTWKGRRYTCTYTVPKGKLVMWVDVLPGRKSARKAFAAAKRKTTVAESVPRMGEQAFLAKDGHVVVQKERFLLTVDPSKLRGFSRPNVALGAAATIMTCWVTT